jgi:phage N-6-adenine-methyltransferase
MHPNSASQEPLDLNFILSDPALEVELAPIAAPNIADAKKLAYVGSKSGPNERDSSAWFTPKKYVASVREALGGYISLDPFSSADANKVVDAHTYYTVLDDALAQNWSADAAFGTVFMNPPYGPPICQNAIAKFVSEFNAGAFSAGVILVNNATDTKWFHAAAASANAICLTHHRIAFWNADNKAVSGNTRGQAFLYFGQDVDTFAAAFADHGLVFTAHIAAAPTTGEPTFVLAA